MLKLKLKFMLVVIRCLKFLITDKKNNEILMEDLKVINEELLDELNKY